MRKIYFLLVTLALCGACGGNSHPGTDIDASPTGDGTSGGDGASGLDGGSLDARSDDSAGSDGAAEMDARTVDATDGAASNDGATRNDGATNDGATSDGATTDGTSNDGAASDGATSDGAGSDGAGSDGAACGVSGGACCADGTCAGGALCVAGRCGTCGGPGLLCCTGATPCSAGNTCRSGGCVACGGLGQPCCDGSRCDGANVCNTTTGACSHCGGAGEPCCPGGACDEGACTGANICSCGGVGQPCCAGARCAAGGSCNPGGLCAACGELGQPCCPGASCNGTSVCAAGSCRAPAPCVRESDCTDGLRCGGPALCSGAVCFSCYSPPGTTATDAACMDSIACASGLCDELRNRCSAPCLLGTTGDADCTAFLGAGFVCTEQTTTIGTARGTLGYCARRCGRNGDCPRAGDVCEGVSNSGFNRLDAVCAPADTSAAGFGAPCTNPGDCATGICLTITSAGGTTTQSCSAFCASAADCSGSLARCGGVSFTLPRGGTQAASVCVP